MTLTKATLADHLFQQLGLNQREASRLRIRGGKEVEIVVGSARLFVCAHGKKRFVIALKYSGETGPKVWPSWQKG